MWHRVGLFKVADVSEDRTISIIRIGDYAKRTESIKQKIEFL
jgi:hypothetical protein